MSQLFELRISPEIEEISRMEPAGGWSSNNTFRIRLKCGNCKDDTKFLPLCMEKVTKSPGCNAHIIHKVRSFYSLLFIYFYFYFLETPCLFNCLCFVLFDVFFFFFFLLIIFFVMFLVSVQERWNCPDCQLVAWALDKKWRH